MSKKDSRKFKCPYCEVKDTKDNLVDHVAEEHEELIPAKYTAARVVFNSIYKKEHGTCVVCGRETAWNEDHRRYNRLCGRPECKKKFIEKFKKNMINVYGKTSLLDDPAHQELMLRNRSISGSYRFQDGGYHIYTGSYEKKCMEFMDQVMHIKSSDILAPGPIIQYNFKGKKLYYISDIYIIPYNLIIEVKDGGDNPNKTNMTETREKTLAKEEEIKRIKKFNYLRLTNNNFAQLMYVIMQLKMQMIDGEQDNEILISINEGKIPSKPEYSNSDIARCSMIYESCIGYNTDIVNDGQYYPCTYDNLMNYYVEYDQPTLNYYESGSHFDYTRYIYNSLKYSFDFNSAKEDSNVHAIYMEYKNGDFKISHSVPYLYIPEMKMFVVIEAFIKDIAGMYGCKSEDEICKKYKKILAGDGDKSKVSIVEYIPTKFKNNSMSLTKGDFDMNQFIAHILGSNYHSLEEETSNHFLNTLKTTRDLDSDINDLTLPKLYKITLPSTEYPKNHADKNTGDTYTMYSLRNAIISLINPVNGHGLKIAWCDQNDPTLIHIHEFAYRILNSYNIEVLIVKNKKSYNNTITTANEVIVDNVNDLNDNNCRIASYNSISDFISSLNGDIKLDIIRTDEKMYEIRKNEYSHIVSQMAKDSFKCINYPYANYPKSLSFEFMYGKFALQTFLYTGIPIAVAEVEDVEHDTKYAQTYNGANRTNHTILVWDKDNFLVLLDKKLSKIFSTMEFRVSIKNGEDSFLYPFIGNGLDQYSLEESYEVPMQKKELYSLRESNFSKAQSLLENKYHGKKFDYNNKTKKLFIEDGMPIVIGKCLSTTHAFDSGLDEGFGVGTINGNYVLFDLIKEDCKNINSAVKKVFNGTKVIGLDKSTSLEESMGLAGMNPVIGTNVFITQSTMDCTFTSGTTMSLSNDIMTPMVLIKGKDGKGKLRSFDSVNDKKFMRIFKLKESTGINLNKLVGKKINGSLFHELTGEDLLDPNQLLFDERFELIDPLKQKSLLEDYMNDVVDRVNTLLEFSDKPSEIGEIRQLLYEQFKSRGNNNGII